MLKHAGPGTLSSAKQILAVAILYENPRGMALPDRHTLAQKLISQYRTWIPMKLNLSPGTPIAARQLIKGVEISATAGLDTAGSNQRLAQMLAKAVKLNGTSGCAAIAFSGDSVALGQTYFAVLAK
jgi:hypothetical protein